MGCTIDEQFKNCLIEQSSQGSDLFIELEKFEKFLVKKRILSELSPEGYRALINKIKNSEDLMDFELYCDVNENCRLLTQPSTTSAYIICPIQIDVENPLITSSRWANEHGDIGHLYLEKVLTGIMPEYFDNLLYRGALIQPIAVIMDTN